MPVWKLFFFVVLLSGIAGAMGHKGVITSDLVQERCEFNGTIETAPGWCRVMGDLVFLHSCNTSCHMETGACQVPLEALEEGDDRPCQVATQVWVPEKVHHFLGRCRNAATCKWKPTRKLIRPFLTPSIRRLKVMGNAIEDQKRKLEPIFFDYHFPIEKMKPLFQNALSGEELIPMPRPRDGRMISSAHPPQDLSMRPLLANNPVMRAALAR